MSNGVSFYRGLRSSLHVNLQRSRVLRCQWRTLSPPRNGPFKTKCRNSQEAAWEMLSHLVMQRNVILKQAVLRHLAYQQETPAVFLDRASALASLLIWLHQYFTMAPWFGSLSLSTCHTIHLQVSP